MKRDRFYKEFGKLVRGYREVHHLTQDALASRVGLSRTSITNIEQGRQKVLLDQVVLLAEALGVSAEALLPNVRVAGDLPEIDARDDLTGPQKDWVRRVVAPNPKDAGAQDEEEDRESRARGTRRARR